MSIYCRNAWKQTKHTNLLVPQGKWIVNGGHMGAMALYCFLFSKEGEHDKIFYLSYFYLLILGSEAVFNILFFIFMYIFKVTSWNIGSSLNVLFICNSSSHEKFDFSSL